MTDDLGAILLYSLAAIGLLFVGYLIVDSFLQRRRRKWGNLRKRNDQDE